MEGLKQMRRDVFWWVLILSLIFLGFAAIIPWHNIRDNFLGYTSLCSFTPVASIVLFNSALAIHSWLNKHRKVFYGAIAIFMVTLGFIAWWFAEFKLPMNNLTASMTIDTFWIGNDNLFGNSSKITFYLTIKNPTTRETPLFLIQPMSMAIDDKELVDGYTLDSFNGTSEGDGLRWFNNPLVLRPNEQVTIRMEFRIFFDGAAPQELWTTMHGNFAFGMHGILTARPFFDGFPITDNDRYTWAAKPFFISQQYIQ